MSTPTSLSLEERKKKLEADQAAYEEEERVRLELEQRLEALRVQKEQLRAEGKQGYGLSKPTSVETTLAASQCVSGAAASTSSDGVPMGMPVDAGAVPVAYPADAAAPTYYPPVAPLPAVPAAMPMAVPTVTPVAVPVAVQQPSWNRGQQTERVVMDEIRSLFRSLDTDGNKALDLKEFVTGAASLGLPPGSDPVRAFELLDVDGSAPASSDWTSSASPSAPTCSPPSSRASPRRRASPTSSPTCTRP